MPVWFGGGLGPIARDVLSQCSVELSSRETGWLYAPTVDPPEEAFFAFENEDGDEVFIGRTVIAGDLVPGMVIPATGAAFFANKGKVHDTDDKQILCGMHMRWVKCRPEIYRRAVIGGRLATGEALLIGRTNVNGKELLGRVDPTQNYALFLPLDGKEVPVMNYELLIEGV